MEELNPKLKPLVNELKQTQLRYYLASTEFERFCNQNQIEKGWDELLKDEEKKRTFFSPDFDHKAYDSEAALKAGLNQTFNTKDKTFFNWFIIELLKKFLEWSEYEVNLKGVLEDLVILGVPEKERVTLEAVYQEHKIKFLAKTDVIDKDTIKETYLNKLDFNGRKKIWQKLVAKAEIQKVVDEIIDFGITNEFETISLASRWNSLQKKYDKGLISENDFTVENNKIVQSLLNLIKNLEDTEGG